MVGSSESWGPQQRPHPWHFRAGGGAVHSIRTGPFRSPQLSRQLGDELLEFGLGPGSRGAGANVPQRASREREFGDVVAARRFDNDEQIVFAGGEIDLFDLDS